MRKPPVSSLGQVTNTILDNPPNLNLDNQGLLHGNTVIEAGGSDEDGEFFASDFDADDIYSMTSTRSSSTSINSSILQQLRKRATLPSLQPWTIPSTKR
ncbi:methyltransferase protein [Fusarium langsethiae]|uniref:Methyltransferase protein n=1 Tax=Fusarium langsethiae TaxID=179993 RepID=A0A0N0DEL5_FUSLA|nr:methyltransferase protein [Fusarium langsethiae]GKU03310.1 unnamed protein product [Fusarium langsethiae]GKU18788.1 unnamed protein product [Fusarium langsethiae]